MRPSIKHGIYLGGFLAAYGLLFRVLEQHHSSPLGWVFYLALPAAAYLSLRAQALIAPQPFLTGFLRGGATVAVGALIYAVYVYGFNAFVDDSLITAVRAEALANIDANDTGAASRIALIETFTQPPGFAATIFLQLLIAGVASVLVIAPFLRGPKPAA